VALRQLAPGGRRGGREEGVGKRGGVNRPAGREEGGGPGGVAVRLRGGGVGQGEAGAGGEPVERRDIRFKNEN
jgi:hypothetical protein